MVALQEQVLVVKALRYNMLEESLIIFVKNPVLGKVKSRLAAEIGNEKALKVYEYLLSYTKQVCLECPVDRVVYYSDEVWFDDNFELKYFEKELQLGNHLGDRMEDAIKKSLKLGYSKVVLIGSDCGEISSDIIDEAFEELNQNEVVIGPAFDGGYYLVGVKNNCPNIFQNKIWGQNNVLVDTLLDLKKLNLMYHLLPTLNDVDTISDLELLTEKLGKEIL